MRITELGVWIVEVGFVVVGLGVGIEYVRGVASQEASEAVRRHELWEHQENDEPDA